MARDARLGLLGLPQSVGVGDLDPSSWVAASGMLTWGRANWSRWRLDEVMVPLFRAWPV